VKRSALAVSLASAFSSGAKFKKGGTGLRIGGSDVFRGSAMA